LIQDTGNRSRIQERHEPDSDLAVGIGGRLAKVDRLKRRRGAGFEKREAVVCDDERSVAADGRVIGRRIEFSQLRVYDGLRGRGSR
jgi:hypothetical protein